MTGGRGAARGAGREAGPAKGRKEGRGGGRQRSGRGGSGGADVAAPFPPPNYAAGTGGFQPPAQYYPTIPTYGGMPQGAPRAGYPVYPEQGYPGRGAPMQGPYPQPRPMPNNNFMPYNAGNPMLQGYQQRPMDLHAQGQGMQQMQQHHMHQQHMPHPMGYPYPIPPYQPTYQQPPEIVLVHPTYVNQYGLHRAPDCFQPRPIPPQQASGRGGNSGQMEPARYMPGMSLYYPDLPLWFPPGAGGR